MGEMNIPDAVINLMQSPELKNLSKVSREDLVSSITLCMIDIAMEYDNNLNVESVIRETLYKYYASFESDNKLH